MKELTSYYKTELQKYKKLLEQASKRSSLYLYSKLLFFTITIVCVCLWFFYDAKSDFTAIGGIISIILYSIMVYLDNKEIDKEEKYRRIITTLEKEISNLKGNYTSNNGGEYISCAHPFTYDIDIFGEKSLFHCINRTVTHEGADRLAEILSDIGSGKETVRRRQEAIKELEELADYRLQHMSVQKTEEKFLESISKLRSCSINTSLLKWLIVLSWALTIGNIVYLVTCLTLGTSTMLPISIMACILFFNGSISVLYLSKGNHVIRKLKYLIQLSQCYSPIVSLNCNKTFESELLKEIQSALLLQKKYLQDLKSMNEIMNFRNNYILWFITNTSIVLDLVVLYRFVKWEKKNIPTLSALLENIGHLDALISLASFNFNHPRTSQPEMTDEGFAGHNIYHPLMLSENVIGNDYTQEESGISIITGANMSGKSTFLRAVALNIVLANAGCNVCATSFKFNPAIKLFTSMRTQDNITKGMSYFNAEIDRLSHAIDYSARHPHTLLILDEVLKGTNSEDKLEGSLKLLRFFSERSIMVIIATHDLGITKLEESFGEKKYKNYCFEIELTTPINYTYQISRGICKNKNASYIICNMLKSKK